MLLLDMLERQARREPERARDGQDGLSNEWPELGRGMVLEDIIGKYKAGS